MVMINTQLWEDIGISQFDESVEITQENIEGLDWDDVSRINDSVSELLEDEEY